jgi:8-oxo-dGTP pyrophosphatase MutT (NUDIX family)
VSAGDEAGDAAASQGPPQLIPRPPGSRPGPAAPWAVLPTEQRRGFSMARVREALTSPVDVDRVPGAARESAVLAPLFDEDGEARVVLTRRASTLRSHRSEVSFPGGRVEPGETLLQAALRETKEEVGIDPATVEVIGTLTPLMTFSSGALIQPFIGILPARPALRTDPAEVELAFDVSLSDLLADELHRSERWEMGEVARDIHFFELPGDIIWGATGRMLVELLARLTGTMPADGVRPEDGPLP